MNRALSICFFVLLGAGLLSHVLSSGARDTGAVEAAVEPDSVYSMGIDAIIFELQRDNLIESLKGGLFEMTSADTRGVLTRAYAPEQLTGKLRRVHGEFVRHTAGFPPPDSSFFVISFAEEKPVLLDSLMAYWRRRIASLPDCSPLQVAPIGFGAATFVLARPAGRRERADSLSWALAVIAVAVALFGVWASLRGGQLDLWSVFFDRPRAELSPSTLKWFSLVIHVVHAAIGVAGSKAFVYAAVCMALAVGLRVTRAPKRV